MSEPVKQQPTSLQEFAMRLQHTDSEGGMQTPYPATNNPDAWKKYWKEQGQPWRTEKIITDKRQKQLDKRRTTVKPNVEKGKYPFKGMKLRRADIEWLLATHKHQSLCGPIDWSDENQQEHEGLDLRGADLRGIDLQGLPLTRLLGGVDYDGVDPLLEDGRRELYCRKQPALLVGMQQEKRMCVHSLIALCLIVLRHSIRHGATASVSLQKAVYGDTNNFHQECILAQEHRNVHDLSLYLEGWLFHRNRGEEKWEAR